MNNATINCAMHYEIQNLLQRHIKEVSKPLDIGFMGGDIHGW